jgi:hypothetical protein
LTVAIGVVRARWPTWIAASVIQGLALVTAVDVLADTVRGELWQNAGEASDASKVPDRRPDAEFVSTAIDYDSRSTNGERYTPAIFLNHPVFLKKSATFNPDGKLDGTFIRFTGSILLKAGKNKFLVLHDDGLVLTISDRGIGTVVSRPGSTSPATTPFEVTAPMAGRYAFTLTYGECCGPPAALRFIVNDTVVGKATLMDSTTLVVTFGFLAFMVERLTNGISILLGYWDWWRAHMEPLPAADEATRSRIDRNRRVGLFALSLLLSVAGALLTKLNLLASVSGLGDVPPHAGYVITGLVIAAGADPIRELLNLRDRRDEGRESRQPSPVQVTGTLIVQQARAVGSETTDKPAS